MDVRTDDTGKLLFRWDEENDLIYIVHKGTLYKIQLMRNTDHHTYKIVDKWNKHDVGLSTRAVN